MKKYIAGFMALTLAVSSLFTTKVFASDEILVALPRVIGVTTLGTGEDLVGLQAGWTQGTSPASSTAPELRLEVRDTKHLATSEEDIVVEFTLSLDNAEFKGQVSEDGVTPVEFDDLTAEDFLHMITILDSNGRVAENVPDITVKEGNYSNDEVTYTLTTPGEERDDRSLRNGHVVVVDLASVIEKSTKNSQAIVNVESSDMGIEKTELVYANVVDRGFSASIRKIEQVSIDESVVLSNKITIKEGVSGSFQAEIPAKEATEGQDAVEGQEETEDQPAIPAIPATPATPATDRVSGTEFTFKLSKGFSFVNSGKYEFSGTNGDAYDIKSDEFTIEVETLENGSPATQIDISNLEIEATNAKLGDIATIKIYSKNMDTVTLEVVEVVDYTVILSTNDEQDIPLMYSGVDSSSTGLTVHNDTSTSMEILIEETFPGAWSMRDGFTFTLPDGVFVADANVIEVRNFTQDGKYVTAREFEEVMKEAYINGEYKSFDFKRRSFDDVDHTLATDKASVLFELTLVAQPDFEGYVEFGFEGGLVDDQTVTIAEFVRPFTVYAEQNDVIIDYRNTKIPTAIRVVENEAGLLEKGSEIKFSVDRGDYIQFEKGASFTASEASEMTVEGSTDITNGIISFVIKEESYDKPAEIIIDDMELFMQRSIPAGAYDLAVTSSLEEAFLAQDLFGEGTIAKQEREDMVDDFDDYSTIVNEAFVNVVTAGSDKDNTFTTKIVVKIGENTLMAGSREVELDAPAYISAEGFTMLPVRAVANALGVDTNSVIWNNETKAITIMYGQRIITMKVGESHLTINGSSVPSSAAPAIKDDRAFLPLRDLAIALGVNDIHWDEATRTATLNGGEGVNVEATEESGTPVAPTVVAPENIEIEEVEVIEEVEETTTTEEV